MLTPCRENIGTLQEGMTDLKSVTGKMEEDIAFVKSSQQTQIKEAERNDIRRWLRIDGIESEARYLEALSQRHGTTGSWVLECASFSNWLVDRGACMWLYGIGENISARLALCRNYVDIFLQLDAEKLS